MLTLLIDQYFRDNYTLFRSDIVKNKFSLWCFYQYLCLKNIVGKITGKNFKTQTYKNIKFEFGNFGSFFAMFTEIFIYNVYYFETDNKTPYIIDCGGNIGMSVLYFKSLYPDAIIETFEPDRDTVKILERNLKNNNITGVTIHENAVSDAREELEFYSFASMEGGPGNTLEKKHVNFDNIESYKVQCVKLSETVKPDTIDFLKIDIEGTEWRVFKDLEENSDLLSRVKHISLEYHYDYYSDNNMMSGILSILEKNKFNIIINANTLVDIYYSKKKYINHDKKYVLMLDCYRDVE